MTDQTYFAHFGKITDPGSYAHLYRDLPSDVPSLVQVVQGLMVHIFWGERYGLNLSEARKAEVQLRSMERRLSGGRRWRCSDPARSCRRLPRQGRMSKRSSATAVTSP